MVKGSVHAVGAPPVPPKGCRRMSQSPLTTTESHMAGRTRQLVEAPMTPTLLRLAMPNVVVMVAQAIVSTCEVYFLGWLGTEALAGVSLVFPLIMLMQTMSAGGMGGGVASAVARLGRWPPPRCQCAGPARADYCRRYGGALHHGGVLGWSGALPCYGWGRQGAGCGADVLERGVCWRSGLLALQHPGERRTRHGQHAVACCAGDWRGCTHPAALPGADSGLGASPSAGHCGSRCCPDYILQSWQPGLAGLSVFRPEPGTACHGGDTAPAPHILGDPARGHTRVAQYSADQSERRTAHQSGRSLWHLCPGRVWLGRASGISANSLSLWLWRRVGDDGGYQYRRRPHGTCAACGLGGRWTGGGRDREYRALWRRLPAPVARAV